MSLCILFALLPSQSFTGILGTHRVPQNEGYWSLLFTITFLITIQTEMFIDQALSIYLLSPQFQAALLKAWKATTFSTMVPTFISQLVKHLVSWASSAHKSLPGPQFPSNAYSHFLLSASSIHVSQGDILHPVCGLQLRFPT